MKELLTAFWASTEAKINAAGASVSWGSWLMMNILTPVSDIAVKLLPIAGLLSTGLMIYFTLFPRKRKAEDGK